MYKKIDSNFNCYNYFEPEEAYDDAPVQKQSSNHRESFKVARKKKFVPYPLDSCQESTCFTDNRKKDSNKAHPTTANSMNDAFPSLLSGEKQTSLTESQIHYPFVLKNIIEAESIPNHSLRSTEELMEELQTPFRELQPHHIFLNNWVLPENMKYEVFQSGIMKEFLTQMIDITKTLTLSPKELEGYCELLESWDEFKDVTPKEFATKVDNFFERRKTHKFAKDSELRKVSRIITGYRFKEAMANKLLQINFHGLATAQMILAADAYISCVQYLLSKTKLKKWICKMITGTCKERNFDPTLWPALDKWLLERKNKAQEFTFDAGQGFFFVCIVEKAPVK
jgi:hypothetical protein